MISDREKELAEQRRRFDVEALALKSFRETGQFTLAMPGYRRMQWKPTTESEAVTMARHAAFVATNTRPLPLRFAHDDIGEREP